MGDGNADEVSLARCQATVARAAKGEIEGADVLRFISDLTSLPLGHPERSRLAVTMIMALTNGGGMAPTAMMGHLDGLLQLVDHVPESVALWPQVRASARAQVLMYAVLKNLPVDLVAAKAELVELAKVVSDTPALKVVVEGAQRAVTATHATQVGDDGAVANLHQFLTPLVDQIGDRPVAHSMRSVADLLKQAMTAHQADDHGKMMSLLREVQEKSVDFPGLSEAISTSLAAMEALIGSSDGRPSEEDPHEVASRISQSFTQPDSSVAEQVSARLLAAGALLRSGEETDITRIDVAVEQCREAVALGDDHVHYPFALVTLAVALLRRSELLGTTEGLDEAAEILRLACDRCGGPQHPQWGFAKDVLAKVHHRLWNLAESGDFGKDAQRSYVWRALLMSDAAGARTAIQNAVSAAIELARTCVATGRLADAVRALDTGRGLMLYAEVELRNVATRLRSIGRSDLADRWDREGRDTEGLRREVMTAILTHPKAADSLLDPPGLGQIRTALDVVDADALVYLVPADESLSGLVVIAPREGEPAFMALPGLRIQEGEAVERYLTVLVRRSRETKRETTRETKPVADSSFGDQVDALCDWAWGAAIGPLLEQYFGRTAGYGREPRIVLVPMGDLARIPWAAARRPDGRYAVELAAFSQAASARLFCDNAAKPRIKPSSTGLIVGDPDTTTAGLKDSIPLEAARHEAYALWQAFYRAARYVGRLPDGAPSASGVGTVEEISSWLADAAPQAGTTLHLACHGVYDLVDDTPRAALLLAPNDEGSRELGTEEIIRILAAVPERRISLVVMAACHTGRSIHGYDEAYSLGTALLAGSVRTVLSTQWAIPDETTPSLMFLFHHYLREEGMTAWEALRRAQIWMLDATSEPPASMPAKLRSMLAEHDHTRVVSWAGFTHGGH